MDENLQKKLESIVAKWDESNLKIRQIILDQNHTNGESSMLCDLIKVRADLSKRAFALKNNWPD